MSIGGLVVAMVLIAVALVVAVWVADLVLSNMGEIDEKMDSGDLFERSP